MERLNKKMKSDYVALVTNYSLGFDHECKQKQGNLLQTSLISGTSLIRYVLVNLTYTGITFWNKNSYELSTCQQG